MIKVIGFTLIMFNSNGGPITDYWTTTGRFPVFETKTQCEKNAEILNDASSSKIIRYACIPQTSLETSK
uniref:Uncharacterized protein n=1 Tax=Rhizobium phage LG08 TaxID=3129229 RepID=A0AAU8HY58_9CAUD